MGPRFSIRKNIWQYPEKGTIFHLISLKIVVNDMALPFWFFGLSLKIQSRCFLHVKGSPKIPRFFRYHVFKVHAERLKMVQILRAKFLIV